MHPCRQYNCLPDRDLFWYTSKISHNQHIYIISCQWLAKHSFPYFVFILESACFWNKTADVSISVGVAVAEVNSVIVIFRSVFEGQTIVNGSISIICWLHGGGRSVINGIRTKVLGSSKLRGVLVFERFLDATCLIISDVKAVSLPADVGGVCIL